MIVRRENWKGKYRVVSRDIKGKIISWKKWNNKINMRMMRELAKMQGGSLIAGIEREKFVKVIEVRDYSAKPKKPSNKKYQYVIETIVNNKKIIARSPQRDPNFPKSKAREEALERLYERISEAITGGYDANEGEKFFKQERLAMKEGIVYYVDA